MSTKPRPSNSAKQSKISNSWTDALEAITINDDHWWCMITMIVETIPAHTRFIQLFDEAAAEGCRKAIYSLTFKKMMSSVKTLSKIDQEKCPVAQEVFLHANKLIARGEKLEPWLMARLVKYLVYRAKEETIARSRRQSDLEQENDRNIRAMLVATNVESQRSMNSSKSKKKSAQSFEVSATSKANTHLRKRGEEQKDKVYMDDSPENGPNLFIILTGFRDPEFPLELVKAGLPLNCVLKIKHPNESLIVIENPEKDLEEKDRVNNRAEDHVFGGLTEKRLSEFWSILKKSANDRDNLEAYSSVIFRCFCPPQIPSYEEIEEVERSKKDLYDRVSCIVYDLYDLQRLHADYIRSIKLQNIPDEPRRESNVYTKIMNEVPAECSFVSVILQAMIAQVETDLEEQPSSSTNIRLPSLGNRTNPDSIVNSKCNGHSFLGQRSENTKYLWHSFDLENRLYDHSNIEQSSSNFRINTSEQPLTSSMSPKVIIDYDQLQSKTYHVSLGDYIKKLVIPEPTSLAELAERSLRDPRIIGLWNDLDVIPEETMKKYRNYVNNLVRCFSVPMNSKRLVHYLHLRFFDKMIHGRFNRSSTGYEDRRIVIAQKEAITLAVRSDPLSLSSKSSQDDQTLASGGDMVECAEILDAPEDTRKILKELDGSLETWNEKLGETEADSSYLEEFIDVRSLSSRVLLQAIHECFGKYQSFHTEYIEITDSILLCFGNVDHSRDLSNSDENVEEQVFQYDNPCLRQISTILTPVCFRNFCEYVIHEVKDFIRDMEMTRAAKRSLSAGELTRKLSHHSDIDILEVMSFTENDFILPNSLKGQARRQNDVAQSSNEADDVTLEKIDRKTAKSEADDKTQKRKSSVKKRSREKSLMSMTNGDVNDSTMTAHKVPSLRCARDDEPHKFIGYDLGNFRVQLTSHSETFMSPDGTLVKVDLDEWLYGEKRLGIGIELSGCFLKLQSTIGERKNENFPFHLITENGIIMVFCKVPKVKESSSLEENQSYLPFEFRASWPSGLSIETIRDDGYENPFYILQRYISKGPECGNVSRESCRKFLRNGTVLKFLDGNEVEVLRPNGTIVRCLEYDKFLGDFGPGHYGNLGKGGSLKSIATRYPILTREKRKSSNPRIKLGKNVDDEFTRKRSIVALSLDPSTGEIHSSGENAARVKITRYIAFEHDGRRYEVENDEVSRVYDRSLVRTSTDVETCEKFTRRDDGTQSILNSRGELFVTFSDGTLIVTGYVIEDELLSCDWSDDEFTRFFASHLNGNSRQRQSDKAIASRSSNVIRSNTHRYERQRSTNHDERLEILLSDAFVSVLMTCRMEHECYAAVAYEPRTNSCKLSMPDEIEMLITREGFFDISVGTNTEFLVRDDVLIFSSKIHENGRSVSIYNLRETKSNDETGKSKEILLVTTDSRGKVFEVKVDGSTSQQNELPSNISKKHHRLFALNRDFTGCEYIHKSQRDEHQKRINPKEKSDLIFIPIQERGLSEYRLFLSPLEPTNYSKKWLQKITKTGRINHDRIDFSRSTYAKPYDWLFPFGRHGNGVKNDARKVSKSFVANDSRVLTLTILEGIANEGDRFLYELDKAMDCCRRKKINMLDSYNSLDDESSATSFEIKIEKWLSDLALGIETNFNTKGYLRDPSTKRIHHESYQIQESPKLCKPGQRKSMKKEEIMWYERCIRERIILPYFKNIRGSCFLWITSCVDRALQLVE